MPPSRPANKTNKVSRPYQRVHSPCHLRHRHPPAATHPPPTPTNPTYRYTPHPLPSTSLRRPVTTRPEGTASCAYKCRWCSYHADTKRTIALHAPTAHSWRAARWHFAHDTYCVICLRQHYTRSHLVRHLQRRGAPCPIALIHHYTPLTLQQVFDNATFGCAHNPTAHESLPRLTATIRLQGPLPLHNIQHERRSCRRLASTPRRGRLHEQWIGVHIVTPDGP